MVDEIVFTPVVLGNSDYAVQQTPYLRETLYLLSNLMMGTLAGYVRDAICLLFREASLAELSHFLVTQIR